MLGYPVVCWLADVVGAQSQASARRVNGDLDWRVCQWFGGGIECVNPCQCLRVWQRAQVHLEEEEDGAPDGQFEVPRVIGAPLLPFLATLGFTRGL